MPKTRHTIRPVVGTIDIAARDPNLEKADASLRSLVSSSLSRPILVREEPSPHGATGRTPRIRRRD